MEKYILYIYERIYMTYLQTLYGIFIEGARYKYILQDI